MVPNKVGSSWSAEECNGWSPAVELLCCYEPNRFRMKLFQVKTTKMVLGNTMIVGKTMVVVGKTMMALGKNKPAQESKKEEDNVKKKKGQTTSCLATCQFTALAMCSSSDSSLDGYETCSRRNSRYFLKGLTKIQQRRVIH